MGFLKGSVSPKPRILLFAGVAVILGFLWLQSSRGGDGPSLPQVLESPPVVAVGKPGPDFTLSDLEGREVTLSELQGKTVLINFWATWCKPCEEELPDLQAVYDEKSGQDFTVLAVDIQENKYDVIEFVRKMGITMPVLVDPYGDVSSAYYVRVIPTSFFLDEKGIIREYSVGPMNKGTILEKLEKTSEAAKKATLP